MKQIEQELELHSGVPLASEIVCTADTVLLILLHVGIVSSG